MSQGGLHHPKGKLSAVFFLTDGCLDFLRPYLEVQDTGCNWLYVGL